MLYRSGQQILLGDKVVVKGERLGHVCYIGKLDFDFFDQIYIGIYLDMPGTASVCYSTYHAILPIMPSCLVVFPLNLHAVTIRPAVIN